LLGEGLLNLGQAGAALLDPAAGVRPSLLGALAQVRDQVVDGGQGQVSRAKRCQQRGPQVVDVRVFSHGFSLHGLFSFGFGAYLVWELGQASAPSGGVVKTRGLTLHAACGEPPDSSGRSMVELLCRTDVFDDYVGPTDCGGSAGFGAGSRPP